jgi:hypothetical protein
MHPPSAGPVLQARTAGTALGAGAPRATLTDSHPTLYTMHRRKATPRSPASYNSQTLAKASLLHENGISAARRRCARRHAWIQLRRDASRSGTTAPPTQTWRAPQGACPQQVCQGLPCTRAEKNHLTRSKSRDDNTIQCGAVAESDHEWRVGTDELIKTRAWALDPPRGLGDLFSLEDRQGC